MRGGSAAPAVTVSAAGLSLSELPPLPFPFCVRQPETLRQTAALGAGLLAGKLSWDFSSSRYNSPAWAKAL
ncbi:hypothetical protein Ccl03g_17880 [Enterocloster clostridioformis]|uniref:Uncharacterized protein n=1 Tax=Enterocloster clostridioformis TaxID=1531 RepID=A0A829W0W6_9FIRM|nr:hypothetical protein Ccl03g_17880 [Enterocloster clostridioformis]